MRRASKLGYCDKAGSAIPPVRSDPFCPALTETMTVPFLSLHDRTGREDRMASQRSMAESVGTKARTFARIEGLDAGRSEAAQWWVSTWMPSGFGSETTEIPQFGQSAGKYGEWAAFCQLRLRKDFETLARMTLCRTPQALSAVCIQAACEAASDYADVFGRVSDFGPARDSAE